MDMEIELTIWQRFALLQALGGLQGDLRTLRLGAGVMDKVELSEEERREAGVKAQGSTITWSGPATAVVSLSQQEADLVRRVVTEYTAWPMGDAGELFELVKKLEVDDADKA
jgi:hypothetical protein